MVIVVEAPVPAWLVNVELPPLSRHLQRLDRDSRQEGGNQGQRRGRQAFDEQFRREAVRLAESGTMPITKKWHASWACIWKRSATGGNAKARAAGDGEPGDHGAIARGRESAPAA